MKLKYRLLKIGVCISLLIAMLVFSSYKFYNREFSHPILNIYNKQKIAFVNNNTILQTIYKTNLSKNNVRIKDLNVSKIENELLKNPFIDTANVYLNQRGILTIFINQKVPIVRIKTPQEEFYLDKRAKKFPLSNKFSKSCLLIYGNIEPNEYIKIIELADYISMDKLLTKHIVGVNKVAKNSFILLLNTNAFKLEFGDLNEINTKFNKLKEFYNQYLNHVGLGVYKKISLKYKNQIVATKK